MGMGRLVDWLRKQLWKVAKGLDAVHSVAILALLDAGCNAGGSEEGFLRTLYFLTVTHDLIRISYFQVLVTSPSEFRSEMHQFASEIEQRD